MCRNIKTLHNFEPPATDDEVRAAALQYVRKVSGSTKPSKANEAAVRARGRRDRPRHAAPARRARDDRSAARPRGRGGARSRSSREALRPRRLGARRHGAALARFTRQCRFRARPRVPIRILMGGRSVPVLALVAFAVLVPAAFLGVAAYADSATLPIGGALLALGALTALRRPGAGASASRFRGCLRRLHPRARGCGIVDRDSCPRCRTRGGRQHGRCSRPASPSTAPSSGGLSVSTASRGGVRISSSRSASPGLRPRCPSRCSSTTAASARCSGHAFEIVGIAVDRLRRRA